MHHAHPNSKFRVASLVAALAASALGLSALADPYDPPVDYYNGVNGTGATLKSTIRTAISAGFISRDYGSARFALPIIDRDILNADNIILFYTGASIPSLWDSGVSWNREHTWPQSLGNTVTTAPQYSDLHMLRPSNPAVNGARSNKPYGSDVGSFDPNQPGTTINYRGEAARAIFYAATRYGDPAGSITTGTFVLADSGFGSGISKMGKLSYLLQWHYAYPVDERERRRNQAVYAEPGNHYYYQNNRNAFVDHPEWVWAIWGTQPNNSTLYVGGAPNANGSSVQNLTFGPVITGAPSFSTQNITLNKSGSTPTTYEIAIAGDVTCPQAGPRQAFAYNPQSRALSVGVVTSSIGSYSGSVSIHNTDLTTGGTGQGLADGDDTINVSALILDHAAPSLAASASFTTQTIDFGTINRNSGIHALPAAVFNRASTIGLTAGLDIDSIAASGSPADATSIISTSIAPTSGIPESSAAIGVVTLDSAQPAGIYQVIYTIQTSDANLPGAATASTLFLTIRGTIIQSCPGDLNNDSVVDDSDFVFFASAYDTFDCASPTMPAGCPADLNNDAVVDDTDFVQFAAAYDAFLCP
ncbi:MAG: endonuclease [Phycisphaerales bacterium]